MDLTLSDFTAQLASAQPAPGGGGAAALTGALAASLTAMAANVTAANPRYAERSDALRSLIDACETQRTTLLALIEADAAGFLPLQKAYAIPRTDPDRAAKLAAAAQTACLAPLAMLEHCAQTALLLTAALETASPLLRSDVGCAAALCRAAAEAAAMNVFACSRRTSAPRPRRAPSICARPWCKAAHRPRTRCLPRCAGRAERWQHV